MINRAWIRGALVCVGGLASAAIGAASCGGSAFVVSGPTGSGGDTGGSSASAGARDPGSGGSGGDGGSGGHVASSSSSSGGSGGEDCGNSMDDDDNGLTDCDDPACNGIVKCVEVPPDGWFGPIAVWIDNKNQAPECGPLWAQSMLADKIGAPMAAPAICTCECNPAGVCSSALDAYAQGCVGGPVTSMDAPAGVCKSAGAAAVATGLGAEKPIIGQCTSMSGTTLPPPTWTNQEARVCSDSTAGGCQQGKTCVPLPEGVKQKICVSHPGEVECPVGYPNATITYTDFVEGRHCSPCGCGLPSTDCAGKIAVFSGDACGGNNLADLDTNGMCKPLNAVSFKSFKYTPANPPMCPKSGGQPSGDITPTGASTTCCK